MESRDSEPPSISFPSRMFAAGEEPVGIRVTPYHKPSCIAKIINSLNDDEIRIIKESQFGKLLDIAEKPAFSGRVGRFLMSRQLKVLKKHESWFLFAGSPIKFGLKEFALATGLNCHSYPRQSRKRVITDITAKPYWVELFGTMKDVPASYVITLLRKKTVSDSDMRLKYALLALISSVLLPTSHSPRISHDHAEMIKDLQQFLDYPWGRASFDLLMNSIKERNEVSLSQNTIAFKGFVMALQLVFIEAVPALTAAVCDGGSSGSEGDFVDDDSEGKRCINTVRVREIDLASKTQVKSIISLGVEISNVGSEEQWSDEEEDVLVDNLVNSIKEGFSFSNSNFTGGATKADVTRMREDAKKISNPRKACRVSQKPTGGEPVDSEYVVSVVKKCISVELGKFGDQINQLSKDFVNSHVSLRENIEELLVNFQSEIVDLVSNPIAAAKPSTAHIPAQGRGGSSDVPDDPTPADDPQNIISDAMRFANMATATDENATPPVDGGRPSAEKEASATEGNNTPLEHRSPDLHANIEEVPADHVSEHHSTPGANVPVPNLPADTIDQIITNDTVISTEIISPATAKLCNAKEDATASGLSFPDPSFSIGLTQLSKANVLGGDNGSKTITDVGSPSAVEDDVPIANRKSKRAKVVPRNLVGDYHCDKRISTRAWEAFGNAICSAPIVDYPRKFDKLLDKLSSSFVMDFGSLSLDSTEFASLIDKSSHLSAKVVDVLIHHTSSVFISNAEHIQAKNCVFLDTKFVSLLAKSFTRFSKSVKKDNFRFPPALIEFICADCPIAEATRFYFPFNFDKQHWVAVCIDTSLWQAIILDCNISRKTDGMITKDFRPLTQMFPFLLKQAGKQLQTKDPKPLSIERPRSLPQNTVQVESGITSILFSQAHAVGGIDVCKCITPEAIDSEIQRIAVMIYEDNLGLL